MKFFFLFVLAIAFSSLFFSDSAFSEDKNFSLNSDFAKSELTFKNLRIYPIVAGKEFIKTNNDLGSYINLKEGLEKELVVVTEKTSVSTSRDTNVIELSASIQPGINVEARASGEQNRLDEREVQQLLDQSGGARVNTLVINNKSNDTLFIMAGDIVKGGKQDRVIAHDMLIPPGSKEIDVSVFCIEKSRWTYKKDNKKFGGYYNVAANALRSTVQYEANQSAVWSKVGQITSEFGATSSTEAYSAIESSEEFTVKRNEYLAFFEKAFENSENVIGLIAVTGDSVVGCDVFCKPDLFRKQYKALIHAYIADVISNGKELTITDAIVDSFFEKIYADFFAEEEKPKSKFYNQSRVVHFIRLQQD